MQCSRKLGRWEEALEAYEQALELDPDNATYWVDKGVALARLGRPPEDRLAAYDAALAHNPNDATAWNNRGITLYALKCGYPASFSLQPP